LFVYSIVGENSVKGLKSGVCHYDPKGHAVSLVSAGGLRNKAAVTALSQMWMSNASLNILITAEYCRITNKCGKRAVSQAVIEAGHTGKISCSRQKQCVWWPA